MERTIIQIAVTVGMARRMHADEDRVVLYALANDGTLWRRIDNSSKARWVQVEALPDNEYGVA